MGSCYSGDHVAGDYILMDMTTCNIEKPQQKDHLGMVDNRLLGEGLNMFHWIQTKVFLM